MSIFALFRSNGASLVLPACTLPCFWKPTRHATMRAVDSHWRPPRPRGRGHGAERSVRHALAYVCIDWKAFEKNKRKINTRCLKDGHRRNCVSQIDERTRPRSCFLLRRCSAPRVTASVFWLSAVQAAFRQQSLEHPACCPLVDVSVSPRQHCPLVQREHRRACTASPPSHSQHPRPSAARWLPR